MQSLNYRKWYVLIITIMWVVMLPVSSSQAQQKDLSLLSIRDIAGEKLMEPPAIGEKLPDLAFNNLLNYSKSTVNLSEFRGKLLLLDFWATWCTSCIQNFSKLEGFQKQFKGRFQVLLINTEKKRYPPKTNRIF